MPWMVERDGAWNPRDGFVVNGLKLLRRAKLGPQFPTLKPPFVASSFALAAEVVAERYYTASGRPGVVDHSFALCDGHGVKAIIYCDDSRENSLSRFGLPIEIWARDERQLCDPTLVRQIIAELTRLGETAGSVILRTCPRLDPSGCIATRLLDLGVVAQPAMRAVLDLSQDDDALLSGMRKGHRQQVRWGRNALSIIAMDAANPDRELFDRYRLLHAEVAGRVTRPMESWDVMFDLIVSGHGDLLLCSFEDEFVGGTLILDSEQVAHYASGAYRRDQFDKPLTHYPLYHAAQRARTRGRRYLDIGETCGGTLDPSSPKELGIANFKRGFSSGSDVSLVWTIPTKQR
jgi:hypothetical protein